MRGRYGSFWKLAIKKKKVKKIIDNVNRQQTHQQCDFFLDLVISLNPSSQSDYRSTLAALAQCTVEELI